MKNDEKILIIIAGPTAVGKTALSLSLAQKFNAEIFSCDSRQIYKELYIGTAKPTLSELSMVKHHLINHCSVKDKYDAYQFEQDILAALENYYKEKDIAILTGGTGLFIQALLIGLDYFPDVPNDVIRQLDAEFIDNGLVNLNAELEKKDPVYFEKVDLKNSRRVIRALSVIRASGKAYSSFLNQPKPERSFRSINILLHRGRQSLYERINLRVDLMIQAGLVQEARELTHLKSHKSLNTIGYKELFRHFEDATSLEEAILLIKQHSRNYAKRQITWFKNNFDSKQFHPEEEDDIIKYIKKEI